MESGNELTRVRQEVDPLYWFTNIENNLALPLLKSLSNSGLLSESVVIFPSGTGVLLGLLLQLKLNAMAVEPNPEYYRYANALTMGSNSISEESDPFSIACGENLLIDIYSHFFTDFESFKLFVSKCFDYVLTHGSKVSINFLTSSNLNQVYELDCNGNSVTLFFLTEDDIGIINVIAEQKGLRIQIEHVSDSFIDFTDLQTKLLIISPAS